MVENTYPKDVEKGKEYFLNHRWNCGVELKQNHLGTYTRLEARILSTLIEMES